MGVRRSTAALAAGVCSLVLGGASLAFACGGQATLGVVSSSSGQAGSPLTVSGALFQADTKVDVFWGSASGPLLGSAAGPNFKISVSVPTNAAPGVHYVFATGGTLQASAPFRVTGAPAVATAPADAPGETAQNDLPVSAASPVAAPEATAAPATAPAKATSPTRAPSRPRAASPVATATPAVAPAPVAAPAATPAPAPPAVAAAPSPVAEQPGAAAVSPDRWKGLDAPAAARPTMSMSSASSSSNSGQTVAFVLVGIGVLLAVAGVAVVAAGRTPAKRAALRQPPTGRS